VVGDLRIARNDRTEFRLPSEWLVDGRLQSADVNPRVTVLRDQPLLGERRRAPDALLAKGGRFSTRPRNAVEPGRSGWEPEEGVRALRFGRLCPKSSVRTESPSPADAISGAAQRRNFPGSGRDEARTFGGPVRRPTWNLATHASPGRSASERAHPRSGPFGRNRLGRPGFDHNPASWMVGAHATSGSGRADRPRSAPTLSMRESTAGFVERHGSLKDIYGWPTSRRQSWRPQL
jgi:hypothetical protein